MAVEQSFSSADTVLAKLKAKIRKIDRNIREMLREQTELEADGGRRELALAQAAITVI
jgi:hypothetical protein